MKEKLKSILDCLIEEHRIEPGMFPGDRLRKVVKPGFLLLALAVIVVSAVTLIPSAISTGAGAGKRDLPIYCVQTEEKKIALSFDAAWGNEDTSKILEILKKHNVKVTFFMTGGWVENYPDDVKAILAHGHDLGNHSENHKHMTQLSENEKTEELMKVHNKVKELTGYDMFLFRPPYGDYDNGVVKTARDCGYYTVQWDVDSLDWKDLSAKEILSRVCKRAQSGSIILMHNNGLHTAKAVPMIIRALKDKGLKFVPIGELIYRENFSIDANGKQFNLN